MTTSDRACKGSLSDRGFMKQTSNHGFKKQNSWSESHRGRTCTSHPRGTGTARPDGRSTATAPPTEPRGQGTGRPRAESLPQDPWTAAPALPPVPEENGSSSSSTDNPVNGTGGEPNHEVAEDSPDVGPLGGYVTPPPDGPPPSIASVSESSSQYTLRLPAGVVINITINLNA
mmetsp:Transcript_11608/g.27595  ORF Transcript_11608/g.27595 Transcript_11608/m.27595 type:complete len:173 (-) Transcript_11608:116-634(-)